MPAVLRQALRALRRSPGFTIAALATFALGVGANATVFGVVNAVPAPRLPVRGPSRLVALYEADPGAATALPLSPGQLPRLAATSAHGSGMAAVDGAEFTLRARTTARAGAARRQPRHVDAAARARRDARGSAAPSTPDDAPGRAAVAIISHRLWQSRVRAARGGRRAGGRTSTGSRHRRRRAPRRTCATRGATADVWLPFAMSDSAWTAQRGNHQLDAVGRLAPGATVEQARAELRGIARQLEIAYPEEQTNFGASVFPLHEALTSGVRPALLVLLGAVTFVLLLACANVANLTLARGAARQREVALRAAVGAGRWQLVRGPLTESLLLGLGGGALGLALAGWACAALPALVPADIPRLDEAGIDWRVAAFTLGLSLLGRRARGVLPRSRRRGGPRGVLKAAARARRPGAARPARATRSSSPRWRSRLVLLTGAGLAVTSLGALLRVAPGFAPEQVLTRQVALPRALRSDTCGALGSRASAASVDAGANAAARGEPRPLGGGMRTAATRSRAPPVRAGRARSR
jgi:predicted permease